MGYKILPYSFKRAKELGVEIKPSTRKDKKIDVYKDGYFIYSIGNSNYYDFPTYMEIDKELALDRRRLYHLRHKKDNIVGTKGWYALNILW